MHGFTLPEVMVAMVIGISGALMLETAMSQWLYWELEAELLQNRVRTTPINTTEQNAIPWSETFPQCEI